MGIAIRATGANFSKFVSSLTLPDRDGLLAEYHLGTSDAASLVNHANSAAPMTVVGTPVHSTYYTSVRSGGVFGSHGFETGLTAPANFTVLSLVRKDSGFPGFMCRTDSGFFSGFLNYSNKPMFYNEQNGLEASVADLAVPAHSDFFLLAGTAPLAQVGNIYKWEAGVRSGSTAEVAGQPSRGATGTFKIGTTDALFGTGKVDFAYGALFERVLTTDELDAAYTALKAFFTDRGLTVS
jgi:hypothetical protein